MAPTQVRAAPSVPRPFPGMFRCHWKFNFNFAPSLRSLPPDFCLAESSVLLSSLPTRTTHVHTTHIHPCAYDDLSLCPQVRTHVHAPVDPASAPVGPLASPHAPPPLHIYSAIQCPPHIHRPLPSDHYPESTDFLPLPHPHMHIYLYPHVRGVHNRTHTFLSPT